MKDKFIATMLLSKKLDVLSGSERAVCVSLAEGFQNYDELDDRNLKIFESLKTEFASELKDLIEPDQIGEDKNTSLML